jgi:Transposase DDE domain
MHDSASPSSSIKDWLRAIGSLLGDVDLEELAFRTKALVRHRGVPNAESLLHLALARGPGGLSLRQTAAWAHLAGVAELTDPSLSNKLHQSCDFLAAIVALMLQNKAGCSQLRDLRGRTIRIADGSTISKPGSKGVDWRIHAIYDLNFGGFSHLELTDAHGAEAIDRGSPTPGEIRIADRGYAKAKALRRLHDEMARNGGDFIVRTGWNALRLSTMDGSPFDLCRHLKDLPAETEFADVNVRIEKAGAPMPIRLAIRRKQAEAVEAEMKRIKRNASRYDREIDLRSVIAAQFVVLVTTLDKDQIPAAEVFDIYRLRWQIELAFKRLKSLLNVGELPNKSEKGGKSWLYSQLIFAIATDVSAQDFLDSFPSGPR